MPEQIPIPEAVQLWAQYVIEKWERKIMSMGVVNSYNLMNSFTSEIVTASNGDIDKVTFAFLYYGRFVDMGVGKGVPISLVGSPGINRRPKKWYSPMFSSQVKALSEILAQKYSRKAALLIVETHSGINLNF